jgi:hypothetical protein
MEADVPSPDTLSAAKSALVAFKPEAVARLASLQGHLADLMAEPVKDSAARKELARTRLEIARLTRDGWPKPPFWLICGPSIGPLSALEDHVRSLRGIADKNWSVFTAIRWTRQQIRSMKRHCSSPMLIDRPIHGPRHRPDSGGGRA